MSERKHFPTFVATFVFFFLKIRSFFLFLTTVHYLQYSTYNTYLQFEILRQLTILYSTLLYIYIYTYIYISVQHKKGGGAVEQTFFKKKLPDQRRQKKSITHIFLADSLKN